MPRKLRPAAMSLAEVLTYCQAYTVPDYQRVYAWGEDQVEGLLSDIETAMGRDEAWLYLGTIYLAGPSDLSGAEIADGQQRLLTATMLYAAGRDLADEPPEDRATGDRYHAMLLASASTADAPAYRFVPRDLDAPFFRQWVQERGATLRSFPVDGGASESEGAGDTADGAADTSFAGLSESRRNIITNRDSIVAKLRVLGPDGRRQFFATLATATDVVIITAPTLDEARNAYASTQTRGLRQSETDRLKVELLGDLPSVLRAELALQWEKCEADLGAEHFRDLFEHLVFIASGRKPQFALEADLTKVFGLPANIKPFIEDSLVPAAVACRRLLSAPKGGGPLQRATADGRRQLRINAHLITLLRTSHDTWKAPAILALRMMGNDGGALERFLRELERLSAVLMITGTDPQKVTDRYAALIAELKDGRGASSPSLQPAPAELKHARACLNETRFALRDRFRMPVLLKLNDLLAGPVRAIDTRSISCEHILPRNIGARSPWHGIFRTADRGRYDGSRYVHALGNLAILSHDDNRLAGNLAFDRKQPILAGSEFAIANDAARAKAWTPEHVVARTARLAAMLIDHWRL